MEKKVYFLFVHPHRQRSRANLTVLERVKDLPQVTAVDLYETYPGFHIQVAREQEMLSGHQILMIQHPIYWYSVPPLMKLWYDEVLELGFAYGPGSTALTGKIFQLSVTTGGSSESYSPSGLHRRPILDFLLPYEETAHLCGMQWQSPLVCHSISKASPEEIEAHAERVRDRILHLTNPLYQTDEAGD